ncbi:MAG: glycoside hydrolase family 3 C-terminal domain-containing protein [Candidatus Acidiferrales bacterium]
MRIRFHRAGKNLAPSAKPNSFGPARILIFIAAAATLISGVSATSQQDPDARARAIVRQMTLDEKVEQMHGIKDKDRYRVVPGIPRLGIPDFDVTNGPAGAGPGGAGDQKPATALPSPIALAATWDVDLSRLYGEIAGAESLDIGNSLLEAPTINIARIPQNGRTFEGYGEDPYLSGELSAFNIQGIQSKGEIANVKHYAANSQETDRFLVNEIVDERTLREIYLPAFEASIKLGHSASVMCAYPRVNGFFNCENDFLLDQVLRKEWGFQGFVTSDFGATHSTARSLKAGLDLEMPTGLYFGDPLKAAVQAGEIPESEIDNALVLRYRAMMQLGLFDHAPVPQPIPAQQDGEAARRIAEAGIVLLKNTGGILPLDATHLKSIAVLGPYAKEANTGGGGSSHVIALYTTSPRDCIKYRAGAAVSVTFADGSDLAQAVTLARSADVAIVMVGDEATEGRDHPLTLDGNQDALVDAVAGANPRTIVVLKSGSPMLLPWLGAVPTLLEAWYPGEEDGNAVAAILFGDVNPSGKLPITFPKRLEDTPVHTPEQWPGVDQTAHYTEGIFVGYRYYDAHNIEPLFPFGYGLSYTTFAYKNLHVAPASLSLAASPPKTVSVEFDVTNTGAVAGAEVAELYVGLPGTAVVPEPPKQLKGFAKVDLKPGETKHVKLSLDARAFSYWNVKTHAWAILPGAVKIMVGGSSRDLPLHATIHIAPPSP